jgi:predicted GIY-YIG superfamily endonuclease
MPTVGFIYYIHGRKNEVYIGATTRDIKKRLSLHFSDYNCNRRRCASFIIFEINNVRRSGKSSPQDNRRKDSDYRNKIEVVLLEKVEFEDKQYLYEREKFWIDAYAEVCVNVRKS